MRRDLKEYNQGIERSQVLRMIYRSVQYRTPLLSGEHCPKDSRNWPRYLSF